MNKYSQLGARDSKPGRKKLDRFRSRKEKLNWMLDFASRRSGRRRDYQVEFFERLMYEVSSEDFDVAYDNICTEYNIPVDPSEVKSCQEEAIRREALALTAVI